MEDDMQNQENQFVQPVQSVKKKIFVSKILPIIITCVLSVVISGGGVLYFMNQQNTNNKNQLNSLIVKKDKTIAELNNTITASEVTVSDVTATASSSPNYSELLKTFCAENGKYTVSNYYIASVSNGLYGGCSVGATNGNVGGGYKIAKIANGSWTLLTSGQTIDKTYLQQNSIPVNVVISPDAYNLLP